ncbi:GNAT family N-acetyltransferase [uncultured Oscillibacter sp.]|uniref:GNAT family N-acetyltransferase n=1 Tax=uncultured Oscillibacter sp. TaxID=876091 RepID=UPI0025E3CE52|nr:GNAT family N-acetyltransferase [uncultured Oscillibacter sp.]
MDICYRRAAPEDLELLTEIRVKVLRAANGLDDGADLSAVAGACRRYYRRALADGSHIAYLVFSGEDVVGAGGVSFYSVLPTCCNPTGEKAYIMNMYTDPACRRRGIASRTLHLLVTAARERGISQISLEATDMGRPLYEAYGFRPMPCEMELPAP